MKLNYVIFCLFFLYFEATAQKPILLDDIHYYVSDSSVRKVAVNYFKTFFQGRAMAEQAINPLPFNDYISLRPEEATLTISTSGPFAGINEDISKNLLREKLKPSASNPPMYGVYWVAFNTNNIRKTVKKLLKTGYHFAMEDFTLPTEPEVNAVAMYGFDYNIIVLVERPKMKKMKTEFGIDHLQLLVKNLEENVKFYQTVLSAEIIDKKDRSTVLKIGNYKFVLSEPEVLGLVREQVVVRNPKKFVANVDHLGFLYDEIEPAFYGAKANNYQIIMEPKPVIFYGKPTPYTVCILMSPDNFQIELQQEEGRMTGRKIYQDDQK
jgi:catechol 2,3-dioxygenase-like lactoylglutathione lyase family enzyme